MSAPLKGRAVGSVSAGLQGAYCFATGKVIHVTRKSAREARRRTAPGLSVYPCGQHFHLGHTGQRPREEHRQIHPEVLA